MPRTNRWVTVVCTAMAVLLTSASCTVGGSERPPVPLLLDESEQESFDTDVEVEVPVPDLQVPQSSRLQWADCTEVIRARMGGTGPTDTTYDCAQLVAPLEAPGLPGMGSTPVNLMRVGDGPTPLVVVNDVAGEPGTLFAARLAETLSPELLSTFSIIGMDRRGTGSSFDTSCVPPDDRTTALSYSPRAATPEELAGLQNATETAAKECTLILDELTRAFDGIRSAGDLEQLRAELDLDRLHAIGRGEGSQVLANYAQRFPETVGRLILDGAPDPNLDAIGLAEERARSAEAVLDAFLTECANRPDCPLGTDPSAALRELLDRLAEQPLITDGPPLTEGLAINAILLGLGDRASWPGLADRIAQAGDGSGDGLLELVAPLLGSVNGDQARFEAMLINGCNDTRDRIPPTRVAELVTEWSGRHAHFGGIMAQQLMLCSSWPIPAEEPEIADTDALPPIPVIATALDPVTPGLGTANAAEALSSSVLVDWQGAGHGALGASTCATEIAEDYLVDGALPDETVVCPP
ncbi:alpha/beta fold hydrolase [Actinoalloteichus hymeniacidonis]|uniref:TAP-like protein n=1 Tax=Actinoalloteichus hymeniacidonis TaxID=340345 RepID=A0AAC9N0G5_9PSEU|nr:alpha/beta hydrolase [Actinoalloteichus hymeniacidonis]AOS64891.1 TAP-like protein [Actinoalloteichus hymeniacidonis]MBB5907034.1 pimeloyl-ACP methyl ester carboxylesterase [Actinoalloteichus hymeniacidonis]